jgi:hypothetical protein
MQERRPGNSHCGGFVVALWWLCGGFRVALGWLWGAYRLAIVSGGGNVDENRRFEDPVRLTVKN